jgi:integrase
MKLVDITKKHVRELLDDKLKSGLSSNTVQRIQATIRSAYNHAIADDELDSNPATGLKVRKSPKREVRYLQPDQARAILGACKASAVGPPLLMALGTGMRLGEVLGLRWQDVDRKQGVIRLHVQLKRATGEFFHAPLKTESSRRTLQISTTIAEAINRAEILKDMADSQARKLDLVFLSPTGGPVHQKWFNDELKAICKSLGIEPISAHGLRHTAASLLIANSVDIALVQQQLGHSTILLTANTYGHLVPAGMKRTSGVLDRTLRTGKVGKD